MGNPSLSLIVLRTAKAQEMLAFYGALGFVFNEEQHGSGPIHHSAQVGSTVLEIYPGEAGEPVNRKASGATMLGFSVKAVDAALSALTNLSAQIITAPSDSAWGR